MTFLSLNSYVQMNNEIQMDSYSYVQMSVNKSLPIINGSDFFYPQPLLVLLQRLFEFAHRRISGPQVESTPSWEELMWLWPSAFERLCSVPARLSPWSQLGRLLLL